MTPGLDGAVLVVDDTPSKRYVLASWLRRGGYPVVEAGTGAEAIDLVRAGGIGLVVLDVRLPDLSGFEVCERIKSDPTHGVMPVIHVSAAAIHADDRTQGLERGADAYLVEPIDPDELLATLASVLRYYQARRHAERLAERLTRLARVSVAMSAARNEPELLETAVAGTTDIFASPAAIVTTFADGSRVAGVCAGPGHPVVVRPWPLELADLPVGVDVRDLPADELALVGWPSGDLVRELTIRSRGDQPPIAVIVPRSATMDGAPALTLLGQAVMSAVKVLRMYDEEHHLALTLQRSLLPRSLPDVPGLECAVRYVPASDRAEIGGDFYEVARFGDQLMVAVGDVGGHSLQAATVMAELRHAMRAYLADGHGPAAVLDRLNRLMMALLPGEIATLCLMAIDIATGRVRLANAGHPPPLIHHDNEVRRLDEHSTLLGLRTAAATESVFEFAAGDTMVLYTDGLVETRREPFDVGVGRLADAMATVDEDLEWFASRLLVEVGPVTIDDDIAMVVLRRAATPAG